jgi:ParB/RepB/Spo0J family partition protein
MTGRGASPESLLEELSLADGDFGSLGHATELQDVGYRLERSHISVPVEDIIEDSPHQSRIITFDPEKFTADAELLQSVRTHGVLEPIYLECLTQGLGEAGSYRPIAGHRRLAAARLAGLQRIDAIIAKAEDDIQAFALAENLGHRELTPYEKALSLMSLKRKDPHLSLRKLAERSGLPLGTVSSLISAYEKSPPILRRRFAEGMAPRTVQELQPPFEHLDEETQLKLARVLDGATQAQATRFRQMMDRGVEPLAAAQSAMGCGRDGQGDPETNATETQPKVDQPHTGNKAIKRSKQRTALSGLPDSKNEAELEALSTRTGASKTVVRRLVKEAKRMECEYNTLTLACAYEARGGDKSKSIDLASLAAGNRSIVSVVRKYLDVLERTRSLIASEGAPEISDFLRTMFPDA